MDMKPITLDQAARAVGGRLVGAPALKTAILTSVTLDSRTVEKGALFVAIRGQRSDGHDYVEQSLDAGALCCMVEREPVRSGGPYILVDSTPKALCALAAYYRSLFDIPVIGVTGSVGKTTTKEMLYAVLSQKYRVHKTQGNYNNDIGVPITLFGLRSAHQVAVVEMGINHFGEMRVLSQMVRPDVVVMTNIGDSHLEFLGSRQGVLTAKGEIFEYAARNCLAVVNGDDPLLRNMAFSDFCQDAGGMEKLCYGIGPENDFRAEAVERGGTRQRWRLLWGGRQQEAKIPAFGSHMIYAALAGAAVGDHLGLNAAEIAAGIEGFQNVGKRARLMEGSFCTIIDDCYNANPNSVTAAIDSLAALPGRRVCILGDMGELGAEGPALHRQVGRHAALSGLDCLICVGALSVHTYESAKAVSPMLEAWYLPEKAEALAVLPAVIRKGDAVLVKASRSQRFEELVEALNALQG